MGIKINDLLIKEHWYRRQSLDTVGIGQRNIVPSGLNRTVKVEMTQEDFLCEINPLTHKIMSHQFLAPRAVWERREDENKRSYLALAGWEDVSRITLGLQADIILRKCSHYAASGIDIFNESQDAKNDTIFSTLISHYDRSGMDFAFMEVIWSLFHTCDAAIYQYVEDKEVKWKVFSYLNGDTLYPSIDENGEEVFARKFTYHNKDAVEVYRKNSVQLWVMNDKKNDDWWKRWVQWLVKKEGGTDITSTDGYKLVYEKKILGTRNPITYFRLSDLPTANGQTLFDNLERVLSGLSEENKYYAYQMLFLKSSGIKELPMVGSNGKMFVGSGENDDMKAIQPADSSNTVPIEIKETKEQIAIATSSVFITADMLKGGELTSAAIEQMYRPEIQWCHTIQPKIYQATKQMLMIFKELVGIVEEKTFEFTNMPISFFQEVWTPRNESEMIENTTKKVYAGILSRKGAMSITKNNIRGDYEQVHKEMVEKAAIGNTDTNPYEPGVDNNSVNKAILDDTGA